MKNDSDFEKVVFLLKSIYRDSEYRFLNDILNFSKFSFERNFEDLNMYTLVYDLKISVVYDVYIKHYSIIEDIPKIIRKEIQKISDISLNIVKILPDYDKIEIIDSDIKPVFTKWDDINITQSKLIDLLRSSSTSIDFQNIGNTSRSLLQKLSNEVFNPEKHTPQNVSFDLSVGKYKNRLHSYILYELAGDNNKELRQFADSAINTVEKAIDLANALTHKLDAVKEIAEVCVIGTISAISIIKLVENNKDKMQR